MCSNEFLIEDDLGAQDVRSVSINGIDASLKAAGIHSILRQQEKM